MLIFNPNFFCQKHYKYYFWLFIYGNHKKNIFMHFYDIDNNPFYLICWLL